MICHSLTVLILCELKKRRTFERLIRPLKLIKTYQNSRSLESPFFFLAGNGISLSENVTDFDYAVT